MSTPRNSPTNPSSKPVPTMDYHEHKITDVSALLNQYIQEAGGYGTAEGNRYSFILHEMNSAWGYVHDFVTVSKMRVAALEAKAADEVDAGAYHGLCFRLRKSLTESNGVAPDRATVEALADAVIKSGWKPPVRA
jgi:hypothetical protein